MFRVLNTTARGAIYTAVVKSSMPEITLFQYKICPFCHRVRAYLDYNGIPYKTVEVDPLTKSQIKFSKEHKKVPIMLIGDEIVNDSTLIIKKLRDEYAVTTTPAPAPTEGVAAATASNAAASASSKQSALFTPDSEEWIEWTATKLAVLLYPNITRTFQESWDSFSYAADVPTWGIASRYSNRLLGPLAMAFANGRIKAKYNIWDERKDLRELLEVWTNALGGKKFLHADSHSGPTVPDLMVYGVLRSIEGMKTHSVVMQENDVLRQWYHDMTVEMQQRATPGPVSLMTPSSAVSHE